MRYSYKTTGTCSQVINFNIEGNVITDIEFIGGCNGNLKGIASLVEGMDVESVIKRLEGIKCGMKQTSCPDQLSEALRQAL